MKRICKTLSVLLIAVVALFSFSVTAGAVEETNKSQDGLVASITTEKDNYQSNEDIELTFKVTNTNDYAVANVSLEAIIPDGLTLKKGANTSIDTVSLASGESLEFTLTVVKENSVIVVPIETTEPNTEQPTQTQPLSTENTTVVKTESVQATTTKTNSATSDTANTNGTDNTSIKTGNTMSYLLAGLICIVCLAVAVLAFRFRKKAVKYLSLVLCVCIAVGSVAVVNNPNISAVEITKKKSFTVSKIITIDGKNYELKSNIKYELSDNNTNIYLYASQYKLLKSVENNHTNVDVYFYAQYSGNVSSLELVDKTSGNVIATLLDNGNIKNGDTTAGDNLFSGIVNFDVTKIKTVTITAKNSTYESNSIDIDIVDNFTDEEYNAVKNVRETMNNLVNSLSFEAALDSIKIEMILEKLEEFSDMGYIIKESIKYDDETKTVYYTDLIGTHRGISLEAIEDGVSSIGYNENSSESRNENSNNESVLVGSNYLNKIENGVIVYGLSTDANNDEYFNAYNEICTNAEEKDIDMSVLIGTVANLKTAMNNMDFICIECHGGVYELNGTKMPMFALTETVTDEQYLTDINQYNVVIKTLKIGDEKYRDMYVITPQFINTYYGNNNQLNDTTIFLGCCDGFGVDGNILDNLANAFISCGASGVVGHVNSVKTTYDLFLLSAVFDELVAGTDIQEALYRAENKYGKTDGEFWQNNYNEAKLGIDAYNELLLPNKHFPYWTNYKNTSIKGRVSEYKGDGISGPSLGKVKVTIEKDGEIYRTATTDSTGNYTLNPVEPGTYIVKFTEKDHETITKEVNVSLGQSLTVDVSMKYKSTSTELSGVVYSNVDKLPLSGVEIKGYKSDSDEPISLGTTSTDGIYSITVDSDIEKIEFSLSGFKTKTIDDFLLFDGNVYLEKLDSENVSFAGGDGSEENPYQIATPEQLDSIRNNLSANYIIVNDLDLSNYENWIPIGDVDNKFSGILDGAKHNIKGLTINIKDLNSYYDPEYGNYYANLGLFSYSYGATFKNIKMSDINIYLDSDVNGNGYVCVGGIVASRYLGMNIENCCVSGRIDIKTNLGISVGGIAGLANTIQNCENKVDINCVCRDDTDTEDDDISTQLNCGGLTSDCNSAIRCVNYGNITLVSYNDNILAGGISGFAEKAQKCINYGNLKVESNCCNLWDFYNNNICQVAGIASHTGYYQFSGSKNDSSDLINYGKVECTGKVAPNILNRYGYISRNIIEACGITCFTYGDGLKNCYNLSTKISCQAYINFECTEIQDSVASRISDEIPNNIDSFYSIDSTIVKGYICDSENNINFLSEKEMKSKIAKLENEILGSISTN